MPASVRQVLPKLEQKVTDWREYQPKKLTIAPYADLAMEYEMTSVRKENGRTIWRGRNALDGSFLVTVATQNDWQAVLEIPPTGSFEFHISGQTATVTEKNEPAVCGDERVSPEAAMADNPTVTLGASFTQTGDSSTSDVNTVDVLFFYDAATLAAAGSQDALENKITLLIEASNQALENSAVNNLHWHYVAAYQVPAYDETTGKLQDDLDEITYTDNPVGQFVAGKCALHGVDQAVIFVTGTRDYAGIAWVPDGAGSVAHHSAVVWNTGYVIVAHEMAHNFGCHHDRQTVGAADNTDNHGVYSYGYRFNYNGNDTGTIMSYAPYRVACFSNPNVSWHPTPTSSLQIPMGVAEDQPKAANNARVLRENAQLMAGYRTASPAPIITAQPQSATVSKGAGFSLGVTAVGNGLAYQWRKNGVALSGANNPVYSKTNASQTDDGVYDVIVSNAVGQTASDNASVAVADPQTTTAAAAATPASTTSSGGGGGGGGALSDWALAAIAVLGAGRLYSKIRGRR